MWWLNEWYNNKKQRRQERKEERRSNLIRERSEEIFTVEEYDGRLWLFCDKIGVIPCSYLNLKSEDDIMKFLEDVRRFYIKTESKHVERKNGACRMC